MADLFADTSPRLVRERKARPPSGGLFDSPEPRRKEPRWLNLPLACSVTLLDLPLELLHIVLYHLMFCCAAAPMVGSCCQLGALGAKNV